MQNNQCHRTILEGRWGGVTLKTASFAAALAFCIVSLAANLRFGITLGASPIEKAVYATASIAVDAYKIALPLLAGLLWAQRRHAWSMASLFLWLACLLWSVNSAIGFTLTSRAEAVAERQAVFDTRSGWEAKVERAEAQISGLGRPRPAAVIRAELAATSVPDPVWTRTKECTDVTLAESRDGCGPALRLRQELAAAEAAESLEASLMAGRTQLATATVAGPGADPQARALARLTGLDDADIRTGIALFLAVLIELGSALGFTIVAMTMAPKTLPSVPSNAPRRPRVVAPRASATRPDTQPSIERWVMTQLAVDTAAEIPARDAYVDFCRWSRARGCEPCSETLFGRVLTARVSQLGGRKVKRRDRAYYVGVSVAQSQEPIRLRAAA